MTIAKRASANTAFSSGRVTCKLSGWCPAMRYSLLVDSFVFRNPPERKARKRC